MTMRRAITPVVLALLMSAAPVALAQDEAENEDASFLENLIQDALGGEGRTVQVRGLEGLLSSEVRIGLIEMADDEGVFLTVRDVVLDWQRLALVRGRLEVNAMTVGTVNFVRPPNAPPNAAPELAADPEATPEPFALPELPVAVNVAQLSVGGLRIGEAVLGEQVDMSISGNARLADGEGEANLALVRIDGQQAAIRLAGGFENESRRLFVDLDVTEAQDGLITTLAGIPGTPPLELTLKGDAPISDFTADLSLKTDDVTRLAGTLGLKDVAGSAETPDRLITADVAGDVADLFLPDYRNFFGDEIALKLTALQGETVGLDVQELALTTQGLQLDGTVDLSPEFLPVSVDLNAHLGTQTGLPVVLPLPGTATLLDSADLAITYDETTGDQFTLDLDGRGILRTDGLLLDHIALTAEGQLEKSEPTKIDGVMANITAQSSGFSHTDPALWDAAGDDVSLSTQIDWDMDGPLVIRDLDLTGGDISATGDAEITGLTDGATQIAAQLNAAVGDLGRFSALAGQTLGGALNAALDVEFDTVTGAGRVALDGRTEDISVGAPDADGLLTGVVDLKLAAARQSDGIAVDELSLNGERVALDGSAHIAPDFWPRDLALKGRIGDPDGSSVTLPVPGQDMTLGKAEIDLSYDSLSGDNYALSLDVDDFIQAGVIELDAVSLNADGTLARDGSSVTGATSALVAALDGVTATDPEISKALADGLDLVADLAWTAEGGLLDLSTFDLRSGEVNATANAAITDLGGDAMSVQSSFDLVTGPLSRFAALAGVDLTGSLSARGEAAYALDTGYFDIDANARGEDLGIGSPEVDQLVAGTTTLIARARRDENGLTLDQVTLEAAEVNLEADGQLVDDITTINLDGGLKNVGLFAEGFNGPLTIDAVATGAGGGWGVDGTITGPAGSNATVAGDVVRPDGTIDVTAKGSLPLGLANRFLLPRTIDGTLGFDLAVAGQPGLDAVNGSVTIDGARITDPATRLALENIAVNLGLANSAANIDVGANLSSGGRITVTGPVGLTGNLPAEITATLSQIHLEDPTLYDVNLDGEIGINGPLAGGAAISGRIDIGRSELKIPSGLGGAAAIPDVVHVGETSSSHLTRERAGLVVEEDPESAGGGGGPAFPLDILISAPSQIFVRGRGLDVEMGGEIEIGGTTAAPEPSGGLQLIRGRMSLLAQRLEFETAEISLQGDLEPDIRMVASSDNGDITAMIVIEGPASDPEIEFTSDPELPEDEVLAQLFFGKPLQELTPLELAQLAGAINTLTGGGGGVFGRLRDGLGVDDLSVQSDDDGTTSVSAGKYITDKIYTDVTFGSDGTSEVQLNYEIRKDLTARGSFDNKGDTGLGFHFERDY